jgi:hypothetical protein
MLPCRTRSHPTALSPSHQPLTNKKGFNNGFNGFGLFAHRNGERSEPHGPAVETVDQGDENCPVETVETARVYVKQVKSGLSARQSILSPVHIGVVTHPPQ